ncbi:MAG: hypothetical protein K2P63_09715 [Lachnospiraceae bacterium]|nr:hypothetical protein [Lachnospiraceae bacterium]
MKKEWNVTDSTGAVHKVQCKLGGFGGNKVLVDNDSYKLKSSNWFIVVVDYQINLPGTVCNLVVIGNNIRLAVNGVFLDDGKPYEPVSNVPAWIWILVGISCLGGFFFAGILGMCIGVFCSIFAVKATLDKKTGVAVALLVISIVIQIAMMFGVMYLRSMI